jgi:hypothetical protein
VELHDLVEEHSNLRHIFEEIRLSLAERHVGQSTVAAFFTDLKEHLQLHFVHEETGGYFAEALAEAPRLRCRADALLQQHPQFLEMLDHLHRFAEAGIPGESWWTQLQDAFDEFRLRFQQHEHRENELLQEAFGRDIGAED